MAEPKEDLDALWRQLAEGAAQAFEKLRQLFLGYVHRCILKRLGKDFRRVREPLNLAEEVLEDFTLRAVKAKGKDPPRNWKALLATMACAKAAKVVRRFKGTQKRDIARKTSLPEAGRETDRRLIDTRSNPFYRVMNKERWNRALALVKPREKQFMLLRRAGYTQEEAAEELKLTVRTIKRMERSIRETLQKKLKP